MQIQDGIDITPPICEFMGGIWREPQPEADAMSGGLFDQRFQSMRKTAR